jgi:hypothetical protein
MTDLRKIPKEAFRVFTRQVAEAHGEWDTPHEFVTVHWNDDHLVPRTVGVLAPDILPTKYPQIMAGLAMKEIELTGAEDVAVAYLLRVEVFGVPDPGPDATEAEREQFDSDARNRRFYTRPDAEEALWVICADVYGRIWVATKLRREGKIHEQFHPPDQPPAGQLVRGLLAVAYATGTSHYGLPGPSQDTIKAAWSSG